MSFVEYKVATGSRPLSKMTFHVLLAYSPACESPECLWFSDKPPRCIPLFLFWPSLWLPTGPGHWLLVEHLFVYGPSMHAALHMESKSYFHCSDAMCLVTPFKVLVRSCEFAWDILNIQESTKDDIKQKLVYLLPKSIKSLLFFAVESKSSY